MADGEIPASSGNDVRARPRSGVFQKASHDVLFAAAAESTCDVCNEALSGGDDAADESDPDGYAVGGSGLYVWTRGDEVRYEEPPLCGRCGTAIGVMALAQWDLEEDEG